MRTQGLNFAVSGIDSQILQAKNSSFEISNPSPSAATSQTSAGAESSNTNTISIIAASVGSTLAVIAAGGLAVYVYKKMILVRYWYSELP